MATTAAILSILVEANTGRATTELSKLHGTVSGLDESAAALRRTLAASGGSLNTAAFKKYDAALAQVQRRTKDRAAFKVALGGDYNGTAFNQYQRALTKTETTTKSSHSRMRGSFSSLRSGIVATAGAYLGFNTVVGSLEASANFQKAMLLIHTQAGYAAGSIKGLTRAVMEMAPRVGFGPEELAKSLFHIASAGVPAKDALKVLRAAAEGARVGAADLEQTTNALVGIMRTAPKDIHGAADAMGVLSAIVGQGNMRMDDLTSALGTGVLPAAKTFGLGLRDVGAALDVMTARGMPAAASATRLRMTFAMMAAPTSKAAGALNSIGLSADQMATDMRKPNGLVVALTDLKKHLEASGKTSVQQAAILAHAFGGGRTSAGIMLLMQNIGDLRNRTDSLGKVKGPKQLDAAFAKTNKDTAANLDRMKATFQVLGIAIGNALAPMLPTIVHITQNVVKFIGQMQTGAGAGGRFAKQIKDAFDVVKGVVSSVVSAFGGLGNTIKVLIAAFAVSKVLSFTGAIADLVGKVRGLGGAARGLGSVGGGGFLGALGMFGTLAGGAVVLGYALGKLTHASRQVNLKPVADQAQRLADAGDLPGLSRLQRQLRGLSRDYTSDPMKRMVGSFRAGSKAAIQLADRIEQMKERVNAIKWDFAGRLGRELIRGQSITSRGVQQILRQMNRLPPGIRSITVRAMLNMTQAMEDAGQVARGTTRRLVLALLRNYNILQDRGGKYFQQLERSASNQMDQLESKVKHSSGKARKETLQQIDQLRQGTYDMFQRMRHQVDRDMPYLAAKIIGGSKDANRQASKEWFDFQWNINWAMGKGILSAKQGGELLRKGGQSLLKTFGSRYNIPFPVAVGALPPVARTPGGGFGDTGGHTDTQRRATGGLVQIGRAGAAGRDAIPMSVGGQNLVVGAGEQAMILTRQQQKFLNRRTADVGGLRGMFRRLNRPHYMASGGMVESYGQLEGLWNAAGGAKNMAALMAAIAEAESGGNVMARNPSGASGLWQIMMPVNAGYVPGGAANVFNPLDNAIAAVRILASQGLGAWTTYTSGAYRQYLNGNVPPIAGSGSMFGPTAIPVPKVKGYGTITDMVRGLLTKETAALNADIMRHLPTVAAGPGPAGGPTGHSMYRGIDMANWVISALQHAAGKGVSPQPTSGYRPGFDPSAPSGSEHAGTQYPHGAVDYGWPVDLPALAEKMAVVNATRDFKWPLLAPIGFRDDGHASGTGHSRGGIIGRALQQSRDYAGAFSAGGTMPRNGWALVGEHGPELAHLPAGSRVYSNTDTTTMLSDQPLVNIEHLDVHDTFDEQALAYRLAFLLEM